MARQRFTRHFWLDRYLPFGLWVGQPAGVVCLALALLTLAVTTARPALVDSPRAALQTHLAPVLDAFSRPFQGIVTTLDYLSRMTSLNREVARLKTENERLLAWRNTAELLQAENASLRGLLHVTNDSSLGFLTTRVVADLGGPYGARLLISAGAQNGIQKNDTVMAGGGLIGRVIAVNADTSIVMLLTDLNARVPVRVVDSNVQGIVSAGGGGDLWLDRIPDGSTVSDAAALVTSGVGGIFPPDFPVGRARVLKDGRVRVEPHANFGRILYVRVVGTQIRAEAP